MKISNTHQRFADRLGKSRALDHPEEFLGPNWRDVLNFWFLIDTLTEEQMKIINGAYHSLSDDERGLAASAAARDAVGYDAAWDAWSAADYAACHAAGFATDELMGSHILQEQGKSLVFLPMFLKV